MPSETARGAVILCWIPSHGAGPCSLPPNALAARRASSKYRRVFTARGGGPVLIWQQARAPSGPHCPSLATSRIASNRRTFSSRYGAASRIVEDVMRLELRYRSDIDLSQPAMQVEIRSHIA